MEFATISGNIKLSQKVIKVFEGSFKRSFEGHTNPIPAPSLVPEDETVAVTTRVGKRIFNGA